MGEGGGAIAGQARRVRLMCDAYGWPDTGAIVDEIQADLCRALSNHERAGRRRAAGIFREMARWMDENGGEIKNLASPSRPHPGDPGQRNE